MVLGGGPIQTSKSINEAMLMVFERLALFFVIGLTMSCSVANSSKSNRVSKSPNTTAAGALQKVGVVPAGKSPIDIFCIDAKRCWLWDVTNLWQSLDGCQTWKLLYSTQREDAPQKYEFFSETNGWAITASTLLRTADSGHLWLQQSSPFDGQGEIRTLVSLKGSEAVWLAGGIYRPQTSEELRYGVPNNTKDVTGGKVLEEAIFRTDDGGKHWQRGVMRRSSIGRILGLRFSGRTHGIAISERTIYYTSDAGNSWKPAEFNKGCVGKEFLIDTYEGQPTAVSMLDSGASLVSYSDGRLVKSQDAGHSWCDLLRPGAVKFEEIGSQYFTAIQFTDSEHGWALGFDKYLYQTGDGGVSWTRLSSATRFESLFFPGHDYGLLLSRDEVFRLPPQN